MEFSQRNAVRSCIVSSCSNELRSTLPNVSYHSLPSDPYLRHKWLQSLMGAFHPSNLSTSMASVCSLHFAPSDRILVAEASGLPPTWQLSSTAIPSIGAPPPFAASSVVVVTSPAKDHVTVSDFDGSQSDRASSVVTPAMFAYDDGGLNELRIATASESTIVSPQPLFEDISPGVVPPTPQPQPTPRWRCHECIVPGCKDRSLHTFGSTHNPHVSYHILPRQKDRCDEWLRVLSIPESSVPWLWNPRICSLHFAPSSLSHTGKYAYVYPNALPSRDWQWICKSDQSPSSTGGVSSAQSSPAMPLLSSEAGQSEAAETGLIQSEPNAFGVVQSQSTASSDDGALPVFVQSELPSPPVLTPADVIVVTSPVQANASGGNQRKRKGSANISTSSSSASGHRKSSATKRQRVQSNQTNLLTLKEPSNGQSYVGNSGQQSTAIGSNAAVSSVRLAASAGSPSPIPFAICTKCRNARRARSDVTIDALPTHIRYCYFGDYKPIVCGYCNERFHTIEDVNVHHAKTHHHKGCRYFNERDVRVEKLFEDVLQYHLQHATTPTNIEPERSYAFGVDPRAFAAFNRALSASADKIPSLPVLTNRTTPLPANHDGLLYAANQLAALSANQNTAFSNSHLPSFQAGQLELQRATPLNSSPINAFASSPPSHVTSFPANPFASMPINQFSALGFPVAINSTSQTLQAMLASAANGRPFAPSGFNSQPPLPSLNSYWVALMQHMAAWMNPWQTGPTYIGDVPSVEPPRATYSTAATVEESDEFINVVDVGDNDATPPAIVSTSPPFINARFHQSTPNDPVMVASNSAENSSARRLTAPGNFDVLASSDRASTSNEQMRVVPPLKIILKKATKRRRRTKAEIAAARALAAQATVAN